MHQIKLTRVEKCYFYEVEVEISVYLGYMLSTFCLETTCNQ